MGVSSRFWVFGGFGFCVCVGPCGFSSVGYLGCPCVYLGALFAFLIKFFLLIKKKFIDT
jgi:hypothetical protein